MPLSYIPKSLANTARSQPVTDICLCAYEPSAVSAPKPGASVNGPMTNHWVMYLMASSAQSICFDPSPTGPGNSLDLIVTSQNNDYTNSCVKNIHLTPTANLTVGHVLDQITNRKYDKYTFSDAGQGCRFWIHSVVELLSSVGYVADSSEVKASTEALRIVWGIGGGPVSADEQMGMTEGTF